MCLQAFGDAGIWSALQEGVAPGGRLWHWERAALELRRVRRGAARIPLRGNPSRASTSKVPGRNSQEPGSAATRAKQVARKEVTAAVEPDCVRDNHDYSKHQVQVSVADNLYSSKHRKKKARKSFLPEVFKSVQFLYQTVAVCRWIDDWLITTYSDDQIVCEAAEHIEREEVF
ncbi:hypothetical protein NDU88_006845 [Pleurodeles waltl]|uniref:Uncharacterized protein n=1 Tax=Pleurodeles waltl TaxID=8319 RepID=A0AAV7TY67_PLEWA|nr:hypothetical protein NDU88_006845 [Pleurodeles waltl]